MFEDVIPVSYVIPLSCIAQGRVRSFLPGKGSKIISLSSLVCECVCVCAESETKRERERERERENERTED